MPFVHVPPSDFSDALIRAALSCGGASVALLKRGFRNQH
jgi:hypothetical protein